MFNPESLIISMKQVYCRKGMIDFDDIKVLARVTDVKADEIKSVDEGLIISGLYLHECIWYDGKLSPGRNPPGKYSTPLPTVIVNLIQIQLNICFESRDTNHEQLGS